MEEGVHVLLCNARQNLRHRVHQCENRIHESPKTAVVGALAVGYLLQRMPVRAILITQVRVLSALAPPALFLFGAVKLFDFLQRQRLTTRA